MGLIISSRFEEPQKTYNWEFQVVSPFALGQQLNYRAKQTSIPSTMMETVKRSMGGVKYFIPAKESSPNVFSVTFWDSEYIGAWRFFKSWMDTLKYGNDLLKGNPTTYQRFVLLQLLRQNGSYSASFQFYDVFPIEISDVPLNYQESNEFTFDVRFSFSRMGVI